MNKTLLSIFIIFTLFVGSCKKEENSATDGVFPETEKVINIVGIVEDEDGQALAGVEVKMGNETQISDADGIFLFQEQNVPSSRYYISATKSGFHNSGYGGIPVTGTMCYVKISMIRLTTPSNLDAQSGGIISIPGVVKLTFPSNSFQTASGLPFNGNVNIYTHYLSPDDVEFGKQVPGGDFAVIYEDNQLAPMSSTGMIGVVIHDSGNEELKLAPGVLVEIRIPIAASKLANAPNSIPLMSFNPVSGLWNQEGLATRSGSEYIGSVLHFSWWSCSLFNGANTPIISGKVKDCEGNGVPFATVTFNGQNTRITDNQGMYVGWVPSGISISIQVITSNNSTIVGSNSNVVSLMPVAGNNLVPDLEVDCPSRISGNILCSGAPTASFLRIAFPGNSGYVLAVFGQFVASVPSNEIIYLKSFMYPASHDTSCYSGNTGTITPIGDIQFCYASIPGSCGSGVNQITDIDGNNYNVVKIGNQCWMKENLKTSKYRNGQAIPTGLPDNVWSTTTIGAYAIYDNLPFNNAVYGKLYNYYAVADTNELCPVGWHVPSDADWYVLAKFLDPLADSANTSGAVSESQVAGGMMKTTGHLYDGTGLWANPNIGASNSSGFSAIPAGFRSPNGSYNCISLISYLWSSTSVSTIHAMMRFPHLNNSTLNRTQAIKGYGMPVRCVRD